MSLLELLIVLVIVGICGALAELIVGFKAGGVLIAIIIGVIGAYISTGLMRLVGLLPVFTIRVGTIAVDLVWTTLASILIVGALSAMRRSKRFHFSHR